MGHMSDAIHAWRRAARSAPFLDADTERDCIERFQRDGDGRAMATLVLSHLRLVLSTARRYTTSRLPLEDLVSEGVVGLCEAASRFDLARGTRYSTYARMWVRALIRAYVLKNRRIVGAPTTRAGRHVMGRAGAARRRLAGHLGRPPTNEELSQALGVDVAEVELVQQAFEGADVPIPSGPGRVLAAAGPSPEDEVARREGWARVRAGLARALHDLDPRERTIIERRHLDPEPETLRALGAQMGISHERVRQIELRAKRKLRAALESPARRVA